MAILLTLIINRVSRRCRGQIKAKIVLALLVLAALATLADGCCKTIPVAPDYSEYAPILATPLVRPAPRVGTSVGCVAPDFRLVSLNGQEVGLSDYRGKPVVLNFWTYCAACKAELPYIQSVYDERELLSPNLIVLAINVSQPRDQVEQFVKFYNYTFEFLLDPWATVASDYYIHEIPTTFFIDRNGIVQDVYVGAFSGPPEIRGKVIALTSR
jgi:peroxiredoxin